MIGTGDFLKISHVKKRAFLAAFSRCGSLSKAAKRAKVDRRTHYNWLKDDPWYARAYQQAVIEAGDSLQDRLTEMAFEGNVTAAIFLLKGLKPERFRERIEQVNIQDIDIDKLSIEMLDKIVDHILRRHVGDDPAAIAATRKQLEAEAFQESGSSGTGVLPYNAGEVDTRGAAVETTAEVVETQST